MIECPDCGARNAENSTFCVRCGAALVVRVEQPESAPGEQTDELAPVATEPEALIAQAADLLGAGDPDGAVSKCNEALDLAPELAAAYSLLGMAEEQRGNLGAAVGAYRRVLQIDPGRTVEREKLEFLSAELGQEEPGPPRPDVRRQESWLLRNAPYVAAGAAAFCVLMILTAIMVRFHVGRTRQTAYAEHMQFAQASLDKRDYQAAMDAFDAALKLRPDDSDAQQGLRYARRRLERTRSAAMAVPRPQQSVAEIVPSAGPNPFMPVPIGPSINEQPQPQQTRQGPRPPIVDWGHDVVENRGSSTTREDVVFEGPLLEEPAEDETPRPRPAEATTQGPPPAPEEPPGEITIWVSEAPPPSQETTPGPGHTGVPPSEDATRAMSLRERADALRQQGRCQEAAGLYAEAIEAYRADSEANPRARSLNDAAVQACEHARSLCEASQG